MSEQILKLKEELYNELSLLFPLLLNNDMTKEIIGKLEYMKKLCNCTDDGWTISNGRIPLYANPSLNMTVKFRCGIQEHIGKRHRAYKWSDTGSLYDIVAYKLTR